MIPRLFRISVILSLTPLSAAPIPEITFRYSEAAGIGAENGVMRRDPSDVIKVGDLFYVWYSRGKVTHGYDATLWYATSKDGVSWAEKGEALQRGEPGSWDDASVFTPNILKAENRYWLFYTGISNPVNQKAPNISPTAIGLAVAESPDGPWSKLPANPILRISEDRSLFDSLRVDDACLIVRENKYWLYYKGRPFGKSPRDTKMGVAIATKPEGPYVKYSGNPVIEGNHEVVVWSQSGGVAAMIGSTGPKHLIHSVLFAKDGLNFSKTHSFRKGPVGAGTYRPNTFSQSNAGSMIEWGVHIRTAQGNLPFLERFDLSIEDGKDTQQR